ncbi:MAG: hypothetical protein QM811_05400 [Pirellulales bacterium]
MAARENQGLQIALIIFVILTISLSVTTYLFFDHYKKAELKAADAQKAATDASNKERTAITERQEIYSLINQTEADAKPADIMAKNRAELAKYSALGGLAKAPENYQTLISELSNVIVAKNAELLQYQQKSEEAATNLDAEKGKFTSAISSATADKTKVAGDYTSLSGTFQSELTKLATSKGDAEKLISQKMEEATKLQDQIVAIQKASAAEIKRLQSNVEGIKTELDKYNDPRPTLTDGMIVHVDEPTKTAYINIGRADALQRRVTFSVYDKSTNDVGSAIKKGAIEVIEILDDKMARARIVENSISDPILPGDFIDSPLWFPGKRQKFAIAGFIDFDNDGFSDLARLKDLIVANGGTVVAEVSERGESVGKVTPDTAFLILGKGVDERSDAKFQKAWSDINGDAKKYTVPQIQLRKFLDDIGHTPTPESHTVDRGQRLIDTQNKNADKSDNLINPTFRERTPPKPGKNGAF